MQTQDQTMMQQPLGAQQQQQGTLTQPGIAPGEASAAMSGQSGMSGVSGIGALLVNVVEARDLSTKSQSTAAVPQPYVTLSVVPKGAIQTLKGKKAAGNMSNLGQYVNTMCATNTSHPQWNQTFTLAVRDIDTDVLHVKVFDHEVSKDVLVGEAFIPLLGLATSGETDQWVQLTGRLSKAAFDGAVHLRMAYSRPGSLPMASFGQAPQQGCVFNVHVVEGTNIARKDIMAPSDPYLTINVLSQAVRQEKHVFHKRKAGHIFGGQELRTTTCRNTATPNWNETFQLVSTDPVHDQLQILCYDQDNAKVDDYIGEAFIPLANIGQGVVSDQWVRLNGRVGTLEGAIHVVISPSGMGGQQGQTHQSTMAQAMTHGTGAQQGLGAQPGMQGGGQPLQQPQYVVPKSQVQQPQQQPFQNAM